MPFICNDFASDLLDMTFTHPLFPESRFEDVPSKKIDYIHKSIFGRVLIVIIGRRLHRNILEKYFYVLAM